jgi:hypothetical protein
MVQARPRRPPKDLPKEAKKEEGSFWHRLSTGEKVLASIALLAFIGTFFVPEVRDILRRPPDVPHVIINNFPLPAGTLESKEPPTGAEIKSFDPSFHVIPMPLKKDSKKPIQRAQSKVNVLPSVSGEPAKVLDETVGPRPYTPREQAIIAELAAKEAARPAQRVPPFVNSFDGAKRSFKSPGTVTTGTKGTSTAHLPFLDSEESQKLLLHRVEPSYRPNEKHIAAEIVVVLTIASGGRVVGVRTLGGPPGLVMDARIAATLWDYKPYIRDGKEVPFWETWAVITFPPPLKVEEPMKPPN